MTIQDFSLEFDILWNNIMSNQAPGLNEYEKSVFLTQAQEAFVLDVYTGNNTDSFESTEAATEAINMLVREASPELEKSSSEFNGISIYSATLPEDLWYKTGELAEIRDDSFDCSGTSTRTVDVIPTTQDRWYRTISSPFRGPTERQVIRMMAPSKEGVLLYSRYEITKYIVRYLSKPDPIILANLEDGLNIEGQTEKMECKLNESVHRAILVRAVALAKSIWNN